MALTKMLDLDDDAQDNEEADITRDWGVCRKQLFKILTMRQPPGGTVVFDAAMGVVILVNIALMIPETDWAAACELEDPEALRVSREHSSSFRRMSPGSCDRIAGVSGSHIASHTARQHRSACLCSGAQV